MSVEIARKVLGHTGDTHYHDKADQSVGDLLRDAFALDERASVSEGLHVLANELGMLVPALLSDDRPDEEVIESVLGNIENRMRVLAEIEGRMRAALDARIRELETQVERLSKDPAPAGEPVQ